MEVVSEACEKVFPCNYKTTEGVCVCVCVCVCACVREEVHILV